MAMARHRLQDRDDQVSEDELRLLQRMWLHTLGSPMPQALEIRPDALGGIALALLHARTAAWERCGHEPVFKLPHGQRVIYLTL